MNLRTIRDKFKNLRLVDQKNLETMKTHIISFIEEIRNYIDEHVKIHLRQDKRVEDLERKLKALDKRIRDIEIKRRYGK